MIRSPSGVVTNGASNIALMGRRRPTTETSLPHQPSGNTPPHRLVRRQSGSDLESAVWGTVRSSRNGCVVSPELWSLDRPPECDRAHTSRAFDRTCSLNVMEFVARRTRTARKRSLLGARLLIYLCNHFNQDRHLNRRDIFKQNRAAALAMRG